MEQKNLNLNLLTEGLPLTDVQTLYHEFFYRKDYQWWRDVEPGDIVVDIGACVGFFVCHALDRNAGRIIAVEPSRPHLKTLIRNISDYFIDHGKVPVLPIEAGIGSTANHFANVFSEHKDYRKMSFLDLVVDYDIPHIDYLKIDFIQFLYKKSTVDILYQIIPYVILCNLFLITYKVI